MSICFTFLRQDKVEARKGKTPGNILFSGMENFIVMFFDKTGIKFCTLKRFATGKVIQKIDVSSHTTYTIFRQRSGQSM